MFSFNCPEGSRFNTQKFEALIPRLTMDEHQAAALSSASLPHVAHQVAMQVIKTIEGMLDCFALDGKQYTKAELIDVLAVVKKGYAK